MAVNQHDSSIPLHNGVIVNYLYRASNLFALANALVLGLNLTNRGSTHI